MLKKTATANTQVLPPLVWSLRAISPSPATERSFVFSIFHLQKLKNLKLYEIKEMEVEVPATDFNFDSCYFSVPSSPSRPIAESSSSSPLQWKDNRVAPKKQQGGEEEFAFDFSGQLDRKPTLSADELFDRGKIKTAFESAGVFKSAVSISSPESESPKQIIREKASARPRTRSLSPDSSSRSGTRSARAFFSSFSWSKRKIADLLLFRSASEGRATGEYAVLPSSSERSVKCDGVVKNSAESAGSVSARRASAHELHYTLNRAASEEMRKRTFLPYKQGLMMLGCLGSTSAAPARDFSRKIRSLTRA